MLTQRSEPETILRMMNEAGVLGRFIPEFGRIVAMMQFNMYHHYTVDEHLIRAVGHLSRRSSAASSRRIIRLPLLSSRRSPAERALYVAVLLHDIAKGRKEDHSIAGERIARELVPAAWPHARRRPKRWPGSSAITC